MITEEMIRDALDPSRVHLFLIRCPRWRRFAPNVCERCVLAAALRNRFPKSDVRVEYSWVAVDDTLVDIQDQWPHEYQLALDHRVAMNAARQTLSAREAIAVLVASR